MISKTVLMISGIIGSLVIAATLAIGIGVVSYYFSTNNQATRLETQFSACQKENETMFDNMWKTIQQKYQLKSDYAKDTKELFAQVIQGRSGGTMIKAFQESNPALDVSIYKDIMATIEGKRDQFKRSQDMQIAIKNTHDNLLKTVPSCWFLTGHKSLELKLVTSDKTNQAFSSGVDNDIKLKND